MIIKGDISATSMLETQSDYSRIASGAMSFTSDKNAGNFINGPLSITTSISGIRIGGVFKFNPLTMTCIPSTIVTPISTFTIDVPMQHAAGLAKCAAIVMSAVGALR